ncbi:MAG: transporter [Methylotenera sp.]|nr:MAG: transporter [Methylotenera sp.]
MLSHELRLDENLNLDRYATTPPTKLKEAIREYQSTREKDAAKLLKLDIKDALKALQPLDTDTFSQSGLDTQSTNNLTIMDVRANALENNLSIKVAQVDPLLASTEVRGERAKFDQIIFAYAKYGQFDTPQIAGDKVEFKSDNPALDGQQVKLSKIEQVKESLELDVGIKVPLRTGGFVTLSAPLENKVSKGKFESDEYRSALRFSISQPLFRDAGTRVNEASIQIAEFSQQAVQVKTKLQSIRILTTVDKAYWDLYQAWAQLDIRRQQFEYASQNLEMVKNRVKEGLTAAIEINRAEIGVADRMEALVIAETNLKIAQRQLQFYMNEDITKQLGSNPIVPVTQPYLVKYEFNRTQLMEDALAGRLELLEQELKLSADLINIDYLENQTLPMFSLDYQYGALSNTNNSFGDNYRNVLNGDFNDWSIGLKFEMPLSNELRKSRLENAVQQRNQRLLTKQLQILTVKREIYDALDYVDQNWQRILAARQQVLIAGSNYEAELKQFNEGLRTMTEVLETLTRLGEAQLKEVKAITDYQIALVDIAYATGTLLGYSNLLIDNRIN